LLNYKYLKNKDKALYIYNMIKRIIIFLTLNFGALSLGSLFTNAGVTSEWYYELNKAPWTPPGWVFGAAWSTIMVCFSIYMAKLWQNTPQKKTMLALYTTQLLLNIAWNPVFFKFHLIALGLACISTLTLLIFTFLTTYLSSLKGYSILILPYAIWLVIATSLNAYIYIYN